MIDDAELRRRGYVLDADVTAAAVRIFGADVAAAAYYRTEKGDNPAQAHEDGSILVHDACLAIRLNNGRLVVFASTEWGDVTFMGTYRPSFEERLEQYRAMPGDTAYGRIADDWRGGEFDEDEARAYVDILFPPISNTRDMTEDQIRQAVSHGGGPRPRSPPPAP